MGKSNFDMFKFFKGESDNPFEKGTTKALFWFYESIFESNWISFDASDWYAFFKEYSLGKEFLDLTKDLKDTDSRIENKKGVFDLWLDKYLFVEKIPSYKTSYYRA